MARSEVYASYRHVIPAGEAITLNLRGRYVTCLLANVEFLIGIDGDALQFMAQGLTLEVPPGEVFTSITLDNSGSASALTVRIGVGSGRLRDQRLTLTGSIDVSKSATLASTADVSIAAASTVQVLAANTLRREAIISNLAANSQTMRVGDVNAGAARGAELAPGATIILTTTAAIHAFNPGAGAELLGVLEVSN